MASARFGEVLAAEAPDLALRFAEEMSSAGAVNNAAIRSIYDRVQKVAGPETVSSELSALEAGPAKTIALAASLPVLATSDMASALRLLREIRDPSLQETVISQTARRLSLGRDTSSLEWLSQATKGNPARVDTLAREFRDLVPRLGERQVLSYIEASTSIDADERGALLQLLSNGP
jgi:hypothetical protein